MNIDEILEKIKVDLLKLKEEDLRSYNNFLDQLSLYQENLESDLKQAIRWNSFKDEEK